MPRFDAPIRRAKVTEVDIDKNDYGAVRVFIPDTMTSIDDSYDEETMGIIAYPANNVLGGYNLKDSSQESHYAASVYVPRKGSWWWIFFEGGDENRPYYFAPCQREFAKLPPENRGVQLPHSVYTVVKSHDGRAIIVADSPDVARTELTGKKRSITSGPEGDSSSVLTIDGNQTIICINEANGADQILIQSHNGNFINMDNKTGKLSIKMSGDVNIQAGGGIFLDSGADLSLKAGGNFMIQGSAVDIKSGGNLNMQASGNFSAKAGGTAVLQAAAAAGIKAGAIAALDGAGAAIMQGSCPSASSAKSAKGASPKGGRG
jgi:hypothetical protein